MSECHYGVGSLPGCFAAAGGTTTSVPFACRELGVSYIYTPRRSTVCARGCACVDGKVYPGCMRRCSSRCLSLLLFFIFFIFILLFFILWRKRLESTVTCDVTAACVYVGECVAVAPKVPAGVTVTSIAVRQRRHGWHSMFGTRFRNYGRFYSFFPFFFHLFSLVRACVRGTTHLPPPLYSQMSR